MQVSVSRENPCAEEPADRWAEGGVHQGALGQPSARGRHRSPLGGRRGEQGKQDSSVPDPDWEPGSERKNINNTEFDHNFINLADYNVFLMRPGNKVQFFSGKIHPWILVHFFNKLMLIRTVSDFPFWSCHKFYTFLIFWFFFMSVHLLTAVCIIAVNIIARASYFIPSLSTSRCRSSPAYGTIYRITGGFLYAATSNFNGVTGRIFTISRCFQFS